MPSPWFLPLLFLAAAIAWLWSDGLKARAAVLRVCRQACRDLDVQFLDQTVIARRLSLARNEHGRLRLQREYNFEFSTNGEDRRVGEAVCMEGRIDRLWLDLPDGTVVVR